MPKGDRDIRIADFAGLQPLKFPAALEFGIYEMT